MGFMTMLAISLLAGFAAAGFVWGSWSIMERLHARKTVAPVPAGAVDESKATEEKPGG